MLALIRTSIALILFGVVIVKCESSSEQNGYSNGVRGQSGGKAKKIQIVYIKVPLSKVLESPSDGYNTGERGYSEGGGGGGQGFQSSNGIPGEGRPPTYGNNIGMGSNEFTPNGGYGDNYGASNQNSYETVKPSGGQEGYGNSGMMYGNGNNGYGNGGSNEQINYQNDANLGIAYGAAVGNALPQNNNFDDSNYGQESQNTGYTQTNQLNYEQNNGYGQQQHQQYNRPQNDGYGTENYDKGKLRKPHFPKMMANFRPQIPIMSTLPAFSMKGFNTPSFGATFPSFGGQPFGGMGGGITGVSGISGISGIGGITGSMKGLGGFKNKLSMLLGNKFGMGGTGGLLGGMMGWD